MQSTFWQSIAETPWWAYVFAGYLMYVCSLAIKPRMLPTRVLFSQLLIFISLSIMYVVAMHASLEWRNMAMWVDMLLLSTGMSYLFYTWRKIPLVKNHYAIFLKGSYFPLFFYIITIGIKFYFEIPINANLFARVIDPENIPLIISMYGFIVGLIVGRLGYAMRGLENGPYVGNEVFV